MEECGTIAQGKDTAGAPGAPLAFMRSSEALRGWDRLPEGSGLPAELLEGVAVGRDQAGASQKGVGHFGDVQVAARVDAEVVRRGEVARRAPVEAAPAGQQTARGIKDAHPACL